VGLKAAAPLHSATPGPTHLTTPPVDRLLSGLSLRSASEKVTIWSGEHVREETSLSPMQPVTEDALSGAPMQRGRDC